MMMAMRINVPSLQSDDGLDYDHSLFVRFADKLAETEAQDRRSLASVRVFVFDRAGFAVIGSFQVAGRN